MGTVVWNEDVSQLPATGQVSILNWLKFFKCGITEDPKYKYDDLVIYDFTCRYNRTNPLDKTLREVLNIFSLPPISFLYPFFLSFINQFILTWSLVFENASSV